MNNQFSLKELYDFSLKATYKLKIGDYEFEPGETIAFFDKIQIANFKEIDSSVAARGGFENQTRVVWQKTDGVRINFQQGVFDEKQLALLTNARLLQRAENLGITIPQREILETDEDGTLTLKEEPLEKIFIYGVDSKERELNFELNGTSVTGLAPYTDYLIDYFYNYMGSGENVLIGRRLINGMLYATGKTRVKDDVTGLVRTGILRIPKFKLMSDLSMTLGTQANPVVGTMEGLALPIGGKGSAHCMEFITLSSDIDSDM